MSGLFGNGGLPSFMDTVTVSEVRYLTKGVRQQAETLPMTSQPSTADLSTSHRDDWDNAVHQCYGCMITTLDEEQDEHDILVEIQWLLAGVLRTYNITETSF